MEDERKGKDAAWLVSHPRELCKHCLEWNECSDEPWDDISGWGANILIRQVQKDTFEKAITIAKTCF